MMMSIVFGDASEDKHFATGAFHEKSLHCESDGGLKVQLRYV